MDKLDLLQRTEKRRSIFMQETILRTNFKKATIGILLSFIFIFIIQFLIHGIMMQNLYMETADFWRAPEDMNMPLMALFQFCYALFFGIAVYSMARREGSMEAISIGLPIGLILAVTVLSTYVFMDLPIEIPLIWAITRLIEALGMSFILGFFSDKYAIAQTIVDIGKDDELPTET